MEDFVSFSKYEGLFVKLLDWNGYMYIQHEAVTLFLKNGK